MLKPLHLLSISCCCALISTAQTIDTLVIYYKPDQYTLSRPDRQLLDSFIATGWDRISINGYTDEMDEEDYNLDLSKKRSAEVYNYFVAKKFGSSSLSSRFFGESLPRGDNTTEDGRALNRRTEIVGFRFARIALRPELDPMKPVTKTLDNGFIISYRPGAMPDEMAANFAYGSSMNFQLITNTLEMRQNAMYNNTTNGEILSSVLIFCGQQLSNCKLNSPILMKIPVPGPNACPIEKVKFFRTVTQNGVRIWQEEERQIVIERINGREYMGIWIDNLCECINFDFKIPECYDMDSVQVQFVNTRIRHISTELKELNSVYLPRKTGDSTYNVMFVKDRLNKASISFALYNGKRRIKGFKDQLLATFPYDETSKKYILTARSLQLYFPKLEVVNVVLKVNSDKYRVMPENNIYDFLYLSRRAETITVDIWVMEKKKLVKYDNQPLISLPYDEKTQRWVVDKRFLQTLKEQKMVAGLRFN